MGVQYGPPSLPLSQAVAARSNQGAFTPAPSRNKPRTATYTTPLNYDALLGGDRAYQDLLAGIDSQRTQGDFGYYGALSKQLIEGGYVPDLTAAYNENPEAFVKRYGGTPDQLLNPHLRQQIQESTASGFSTAGRLRHAYEGAQAASAESLAARGILHSGAFLQHARANAYNYNLANADKQNKLLENIAQLGQGRVDAEGQRIQQGYQATSDAMGRIIAQVNAGLLAPTQTTTTTAPIRPNPAAPSQVQTPVPVGSQTSFEPKPTAGNYLAKTPAAPSFTPTLGRSGPYARKPL